MLYIWQDNIQMLVEIFLSLKLPYIKSRVGFLISSLFCYRNSREYKHVHVHFRV